MPVADDVYSSERVTAAGHQPQLPQPLVQPDLFAMSQRMGPPAAMGDAGALSVPQDARVPLQSTNQLLMLMADLSMALQPDCHSHHVPQIPVGPASDLQLPLFGYSLTTPELH